MAAQKKTIRVTQTGSPIGRPAEQRATQRPDHHHARKREQEYQNAAKPQRICIHRLVLVAGGSNDPPSPGPLPAAPMLSPDPRHPRVSRSWRPTLQSPGCRAGGIAE